MYIYIGGTSSGSASHLNSKGPLDEGAFTLLIIDGRRRLPQLDSSFLCTEKHIHTHSRFVAIVVDAITLVVLTAEPPLRDRTARVADRCLMRSSTRLAAKHIPICTVDHVTKPLLSKEVLRSMK